MYKWFGATLLLVIIGVSLILSPLQAKHTQDIYYQDQVAVLMYHHIHDKDTSSSTITTALFHSQLQMLMDKGYHFITLSEFRQFMAGASVPTNAVMITFDDGYQSFYTSAYPLLRSFHIPAVNFVITGTLADPLGTYIPSLSKEQITEMTHTTNFIDAQCHTDSLHNKLPSGKAALVGRIEQDGQIESDDAYKQRILNDTSICRQKVSQLYDQPIDSYAYPFGISDSLVAQLVHQVGIKYAFTIIPEMTTHDTDPLQIPRINAGSPNITPELLHRTIQRRIVSPSRNDIRVDAASAAQQVGGKATQNGRNLDIQWQGETYSIQVNSQDAMQGKTRIELRYPVLMQKQQITMSLDDLSSLLGKALVYNPYSKQVSQRITPQVIQ
jgi:peptidoglycan/xylan/chitin deacetylase (PgdA/CDA1 family)